MKLVIDITRAFFIRNNMNIEQGKYEDIIQRLENTKDFHFEVK